MFQPTKQQVAIIKLLLAKKKIPNNDLVRLTGLPKNQLRRELKDLSSWLVPVSQNVELKPESIEELIPLLNVKNWKQLKKSLLK